MLQCSLAQKLCVFLYLYLQIRKKLRRFSYNRSNHQRCFVTNGVLRNFTKFTGKHLWQSLFIKKETVPQVLSCEFCEISNNTCFTEHLWTTASGSLCQNFSFKKMRFVVEVRFFPIKLYRKIKFIENFLQNFVISLSP